MSRFDTQFQIEDFDYGKVNFRVIDRIVPDDVVLHLVERQFYVLVGGKDPGSSVDRGFKDFIVKSGLVRSA